MAYPYGRNYYGHERGPSPWVPLTILGVILLVVTTPFRMGPDAAAMAYQPGLRPSSGLPTSLIWIPIIFFLVAQFFGGSSYRPNYRNERFPYNNRGMTYGGEYYPGGAYDDYNQFNGPYNRSFSSSFMDYGGLLVLIFIGIWLFSSIGSGPIGGRGYGFPWSLFSPQPQIVLPIM